jgi:hypothetical protein
MNKGFMRYMKKHLEKEAAYQERILAPTIEIEKCHKRLCEEMKGIIVSEIQFKPSFQMMIINKIRSSCPKLTKTRRLDLIENNIYIESNIFKLIFEKIANRKPTVTLKIVPSNISNSTVLMYQSIYALAQGESSEMNSLKTVIEQLVTDSGLKKRVERSIELEEQLTDYKKIDELREKVDELWTFVHGGGYLGGFLACDLCDPNKLAPQ